MHIFLSFFSARKNMAMKLRIATIALIFVILLFTSIISSSNAVPLSSKSRFIIDDTTNQRVKLACANWAGHLQPMLPEHLDKQPLTTIARRISLMGFNCIRLTYATDMYIYNSTLTVAQSFTNWGLYKALGGIGKHNPELLSMNLVDAQKAVVDELAAHGVYTVLDCQVSKPLYCCHDNDGNGFWGDKYFDPNQWLKTLITVAKLYKDTPMVVGMSVRNEIRGARENEKQWRYYVELGAKTIHRENPNVLLLLSGLNYDIDFDSLKQKPFNLTFTNKILYEYHRYAVSEAGEVPLNLWLTQPINKRCENITNRIDYQIGFLFEGLNPAPLMVSEWGINQYLTDESDNLYLTCFLMYLADNDLEWAMWGLQGAYYIRDGIQDLEEPNGMFNANATIIRSPEFESKLPIIQNIIQDPNSKAEPYLVMYHPLSGKVLQLHNNEFHATDFIGLTKLTHDGEETPIRLVGTNLCLMANGDGLPIQITSDCTSERSSWTQFSTFQIGNKQVDGTFLCLDYDVYYSPKLVTRECIKSDDQHFGNNPQSQWIKLIKANV